MGNYRPCILVKERGQIIELASLSAIDDDDALTQIIARDGKFLSSLGQHFIIIDQARYPNIWSSGVELDYYDTF